MAMLTKQYLSTRSSHIHNHGLFIACSLILACGIGFSNLAHADPKKATADPDKATPLKAELSPKVSASYPGMPGGSQIVGTKVFTLERYDGVKNDGETAFTLSNLHITVYHLQLGNGNRITTAITDFALSNNTQNDKGTHHHYVKMFAKGAAGNILGPKSLVVELQRDTCTPSNPVTSGPHQYQFDVFDQIQNMSIGWEGRWTYEGKC